MQTAKHAPASPYLQTLTPLVKAVLPHLPLLNGLTGIYEGLLELERELGPQTTGRTVPFGPKWCCLGGIVVKFNDGQDPFMNEAEFNGRGDVVTGEKFRQLAFDDGRLVVARLRERELPVAQLFFTGEQQLQRLTVARLLLGGASLPGLRAQAEQAVRDFVRPVSKQQGFYLHSEYQRGELKQLVDLLKFEG